MSEPSTHTEVAAARAALDAAYCALCRVEDGALPLRPVEHSLAGALERCYAALGEGGDAEAFARARAEAGEQTEAALQQLRACASEDPGVVACTRDTERALAALQASRFRAGVEPLLLPSAQARAPLTASVGLPRLLDPPRPILRPTLPMPELEEPEEPLPEAPSALPEAPKVSLAQLEALMAQAVASSAAAEREPEPPAQQDAPEPPPPLTPEQLEALRFGDQEQEHALRFSRARIALEELGMLAAMRRPDDHDAWSSNRECERRVLCRLDAIVASGLERLPELIKLLEDRPLPDPELLLSLLFVLGSLRGDDTRDQIARLLQVSDLDDADLWTAAADALSLAPHPGIAALAGGMLQHAEPARRALGLELLARKGLLQGEALGPACADDDPRVARAAARALGRVAGPVESAAVYRLLHHEDHEVARHGLHGAALRGDPRALLRARELTAQGRGAHGEAVMLLSLCGGRGELELIAKDGSACGAEACGWFGDPSLLAPLLAALEGEDETRKLAAAEALQRITGGGLTEAEPAPDLEAGPEAQAFLPGYREPRRVHESSLDAEAWRSYVERQQPRAQQDQRYRYGRPFVAVHDLWEIAEAGAVRYDRERAYLELRVRFGVSAPLDTAAFVLAQTQALRALSAEVSRLPLARDPWQTRLRA